MNHLARILNLRNFLIIIILAISLCVPLIIESPYILDIWITIFLQAFLNNAWNILGGYCGQPSFGHAAYFAIGAYTSTILFMDYNVSPWIGMIVGIFLAAILAVAMGYPSLRLRGPYFVFITIGFTEAIRLILINWERVGGAMGLLIPLKQSSLIHFQFDSKVPYYYIALLMLAAGVSMTYMIENSKLGSYFVATREDEDAAESLGINTAYYKTLAFVISAVLIALGGTFYAQYVLYIHPETTSTLRVSCTLLAMAVIGGAGTVLGPVVGAFLLVPLEEYARGLLGGQARGLHLIIYAAALVVVATIAPGGIVGLISKTRLSSKIQRTIRGQGAEI